jgi:hypothetical protein
MSIACNPYLAPRKMHCEAVHQSMCPCNQRFCVRNNALTGIEQLLVALSARRT